MFRIVFESIGASPDLFDQPIDLDESNETDFEEDQPGQRQQEPQPPVDAQPLEEDLQFVLLNVREMQNRKRDERDEQELSVGYMLHLRDMIPAIDEWLHGNQQQHK